MTTNKVMLNIGCGGILAPGFINVDAFFTPEHMEHFYKERGEVVPKDAQYVQASVTDLPFQDNVADYAELVDVIEHIPVHYVPKAFSELYRVLKPGGELCVVTTSFDCVARSWLEVSQEMTDRALRGEDTSDLFDPEHRLDDEHTWEDVKKNKVNLAMAVIYGNQFHPGEYHMSPFTPAIMNAYLRKAGFAKENINIAVHERNTSHPDLPAMGSADVILKPGQEKTASVVLINDIIVAKATK